MTVLIFGIGIGLFTILCLWAVSFVLCILSYRTQQIFGPTSVVLSLIVTLTLLLIPQEPEREDTVTEIKVLDSLFFWRIAVIIFLALSVITGFICFLFTDLMVPCHAQPMKHWRL